MKGAGRVREPQGLVYLWQLGGGPSCSVSALRSMVPLRNLSWSSDEPQGLSGRFVFVRNAGVVNQPHPVTGKPVAVPLGNATPDENGHFIFEPGRGGGRIDLVKVADEAFRWRYLQAARFGEVNVYHHIDRIAGYLHVLLVELGAPELPPVTAVVNAHHAAIQAPNGDRDGVHRSDGRWVPFQGGHYRLPGRSTIIPERSPLARHGEIHLGPGRQLARGGALFDSIGGAYRANASHNPGIIYHEYGHHLTRHTADFRANGLRAWDRQSNKKTSLDEGMADYWAAVLLGSPDIWFFHHRHDASVTHPRSLRSALTMQAYSRGPRSDPHRNGTIWASALWEIRNEAKSVLQEDAAAVDRLVLQALLIIGRATGGRDPSPAAVGRARRSFRGAGGALLEADRLLYRGALRDTIAGVLKRRGIDPQESREPKPHGEAAVSS